MEVFERIYLTVFLLVVAVTAVSWIGAEYYALQALFELLVGGLIGMVVFLPNRKGT